MKKILMITTGGTIASVNTKNGLVPGLDGLTLLQYLPELATMCEVELINLLNLDSTNIYYKHWLLISKCIQDNYNKYDGFIICHGTDTMSYTASALSYLIQNSKKPIVITLLSLKFFKSFKSISFIVKSSYTMINTFICLLIYCNTFIIINN